MAQEKSIYMSKDLNASSERVGRELAIGLKTKHFSVNEHRTNFREKALHLPSVSLLFAREDHLAIP